MADDQEVMRASQAQAPSSVLAGLADSLEGRRNADGGWGYFAGKLSRVEPTCWALLSLARARRVPPDLNRLQDWPRHDGWLADVAGAPVNYGFNALAALTLATRDTGMAAARALARALVDVRGMRLQQAPAFRQDNSLQAWPWIDGTFSWVEPTAWSLLLLKKLGAGRGDQAAAERVQVGEAMLRDRVCASGGWNYGSSNVYGQELFPYVPTTAIGLLALQDARTDPVVTKSLAELTRALPSERSATALALATIALRALGEPTADARTLLESLLATPRPVDDTLGLAMGLYALADPADEESAFAL